MMYLVGGWMRSGTSMMMKCLEAGGMDAAYNPERDEMNKKFGDENYQPNGGGFYELNGTEMQKIDNLYEHFNGKLVKMLRHSIGRLPDDGEYQIVIMKRHPKEIYYSCEAFFEQPLSKNFIRLYPQLINKIVEIAEEKKMKYRVIAYRQLIAEPLEHFKLLADDGWPIDPEKAAAIVDPELYRFKRELLTEFPG